MEKNLTAVELLVDKLKNGHYLDEGMKQDIINQANKMFEEQIMEAMDWIMNKYFEFHEQPTTSAREQWYNETFKSE
jgi:hypothetical protein